MKTKLATALSVVGVLGAGSAAALVNTQILDSGPSESTASAAVLPPPSSVDVTIPDVIFQSRIVESAESIPTTAAPTTISVDATVDTTAAAPAPSGFLTAFNVGEAGTVTVDVVGDRLVLVSSEPKLDWSVSKAEEDASENTVEVEFLSATVRVEFHASFVGGQIVPAVESSAVPGTQNSSSDTSSSTSNGSQPSTRPPTTVDNDGFDDEHESESEHDDEHESERDDD